MASDAPWLVLPADFPAIVALTDLQGSLVSLRGAQVQRLDLGVGPTEYIAGLFTRPGAIFLETHVWPTLRREGCISEISLPLRALGGEELPCLINAARTEGPNGDCWLWVLFPTQDRLRFERELIAARRDSQQLAAQLAATVRELGEANERLRFTADAVTERNRELDALAQTDPLTGLGNRRALQLAFEAWLRHADLDGATERGALLLVDADHFKQVNDAWGHDVGDQALVRIAATLRASVRRSDCATRVGGEEFALWLPGADQDVAGRVAEQVHERMRQLKLHVDHAPLTVSIGIALLPGQADMTDLSALLKRADDALYVAKSSGRNRTCWAESGG